MEKTPAEWKAWWMDNWLDGLKDAGEGETYCKYTKIMFWFNSLNGKYNHKV